MVRGSSHALAWASDHHCEEGGREEGGGGGGREEGGGGRGEGGRGEDQIRDYAYMHLPDLQNAQAKKYVYTCA